MKFTQSFYTLRRKYHTTESEAANSSKTPPPAAAAIIETESVQRIGRARKMDSTMEEGELAEVELVFATRDKPKIVKSAYDVLQQSRSSVEDIVAQMLSVKREGKPRSQLRELVTQTFLNFVTLRQVANHFLSLMFFFSLTRVSFRLRFRS